MQHASRAELDLCGMLRQSPYGDAVCEVVNAAVEINELDYNVAVRTT